MALRNRLGDDAALFPDPVLGVNLHKAEEDLGPEEARLMKNCVREGGTRIRLGSTKLNSSSLGAFRIRGGHRFYYGGASPTSKRLVAYSTKISEVNDAGTETVINSGMTSDKDTHFLTWSITDKVYICNSTDVLRSYDGTTFATVAGTNIPTPRHMAPILDRLLAITTNGIERTSPRVDTVWSSNSTWATFRPSLVGLFSAIAPHSIISADTLSPGVIAFQPNAHYLITGTNFGADASAGAASAGEDSSIRLIDSRVGTSSPYSVTAVPGLGLFWFTSDLNVFFLPYGQISGRYIGDNLRSTGTTVGIEGANVAALNQVWMAYFNRYLRLGIPTGTDTFASTEWWLDLRSLVEHPERGPVWYGPMTGRTVGRVWIETQNGDNAVKGGEGNSSTGAYVYNLEASGTYTDAVGSTNVDVVMQYQTFFNHFGSPSRFKYIRAIELDANTFLGSATVDLLDLDGVIDSTLPVVLVT